MFFTDIYRRMQERKKKIKYFITDDLKYDSHDESKKIFEKNSEYIIILIVFCELFQFVDA